MRFTNLCACVVLGVAIAGCGDNSTTTAPGGTPAATTPTKAEVDKMISDVSGYIAANKWDLADNGIKQLEGLKSKYPDYASKIDDLRKAYDKAKAAAANMPAMSMPKLP